MSEATVVSFEDAIRARDGDPTMVDPAELRARQRRISADDCHGAFRNVTFTLRMKTQEVPVFQDLSIGFPIGRKIAMLGHRSSGKSTVFDLLHFKKVPKRGRVIVNTRISWPTASLKFYDQASTVRQNAVFIARVIGIAPDKLIDPFLAFSRLPRSVLQEPLKNIPDWARRRFGLLVLLACDFDCHLIKGEFKPQSLKLDDAEAAQASSMIHGKDYIAACDRPGMIPDNCDLVYLLYEGYFYLFEDVAEAVTVFNLLPKPKVGPKSGADDDEDEDDEEAQEMLI